MFASLKIEKIGSSGSQYRGSGPASFVKQVKGTSNGQLVEEYQKGNYDYSEANSVGSRGVYIHYLLDDGLIYHVSKPTSWKNADEFYCRIEKGEIIRMTFDEVAQRLYKPHRLVDADTGEIVSG